MCDSSLHTDLAHLSVDLSLLLPAVLLAGHAHCLSEGAEGESRLPFSQVEGPKTMVAMKDCRRVSKLSGEVRQ